MRTAERKRVRMLRAGAGAVCALGAAAHGQSVINLSGATLLENALKAPAITNDYIDADGDGFARINLSDDQLAPFGLPPALGVGQNGQWWIIQYRLVGSVNGFISLRDYGQTFATQPDGIELLSAECSKAFCNRTQFITNGLSSNAIFNAGNPSALPCRSNTTTLQATYTVPNTPSPGGVRIDIAPIDVPSPWAVNAAGAARFDRSPISPGYGRNARVSRNKDGTNTTFGNMLPDVGQLNFNTASPNQNTVYDRPLAFAPIAALTNFGTGRRQALQSDLRHMFVTGRAVNGENFMAVTRDVGSGTRNAFNNSICLDPSWGMGDNIGALSVFPDEHKLGASFIPNNKVGNGEVETTVTNHRLAIGYAGAERGVNSGWLTAGRIEVLAVRNDLLNPPGTEFSRPTIGDVLAFNADGYIIGGAAVLSTIGDPRSAPVNKGGDPGNTNPGVRNVEAAAFLNNITRSVAAFNGDPGTPQTLFTPGEFLAFNFMPTAALDNVQSSNNACVIIPNPARNQVVQDFVRARNVLGNPVYQSFNTTSNGLVPVRQTGPTYSDGVPGGANYVQENGAALAYGTPLNARNKIAGDFNGDGQRTTADIGGLIAAWRDRNGGPNWAGSADICFEIIGDFNGDGNFDAADVRYFADGLALLNGAVNRAEGFRLVDAAFGGNFFGTTLAHGAYTNGASAADMAGGAGYTPGFAPIGHDGRVDDADLDYIFMQYRQNPAITGGEANWAETAEAATFDLSADVTGDLVVNFDDVARVLAILETTQGDVNLDGECNGQDRQIAQSNLNQPGGWADGDVDGDGTVTRADLDIIGACSCPCACDFDTTTGPSVCDIFDFLGFQNGFDTGDPCACDKDTTTGTGVCDIFDFLAFQNEFDTGCP